MCPKKKVDVSYESWIASKMYNFKNTVNLQLPQEKEPFKMLSKAV